jgi:hypothetical protein
MELNMKYEWWGYLHSNGSVQLKRWFGDHKDYTEDCENNPFTVKVSAPFEAESGELAWRMLHARLGIPLETPDA